MLELVLEEPQLRAVTHRSPPAAQVQVQVAEARVPGQEAVVDEPEIEVEPAVLVLMSTSQALVQQSRFQESAVSGAQSL